MSTIESSPGRDPDEIHEGAERAEQANGNGPGRVLPNRELLMWSGVVGLVGGFLAIGYYYLLRGSLALVWTLAAGHEWLTLPTKAGFYPWILVITTVGGFLVGLILKFLGTPGEIAAVVDNIHMEGGRIDPRQTPSMVVVSLASITAGGSAGPEAPLVQILGSLGSLLGDKLKLRGDLVRTLTFCGMGTALGAFFGAPLGGALFALEIPHRRGLEYFEALIPTILASIIGFFVFCSVTGYDAAIYPFAAIKDVTLLMIAAGVLFGAVGGIVGAVFIYFFSAMGRLMHPLEKHRVLLATVGGLVIGIAAQFAPLTLFWSEFQIKTILAIGPDWVHSNGLHMAVAMLVALALLKMFTIGITLHSGFRGGFIFPLFFIGAALGVAITLAFPSLPAPIVILSMMAAVNVAVTKTPISTAVILTTLSGTTYMPALLAACFASFLLTTRVSLISTQRGRQPVAPPDGGSLLMAQPKAVAH